MSRPPGTLTPQQQRFVVEYLIDLDAQAAAIRSGYSARTAKSQAYGLLHHPVISKEISAAIADRQQRTGITSDVILGELLRLARVDIGLAFDEFGKLKPLKDIPEDVRRAMASIDVEESRNGEGVATGRTAKVRFHDKTKALELLGKHLRLYTDRVEHSAVHGLADLLARARARAKGRT